MTKEYFNADMALFLDHRVDWARYLRLRRGEEGGVATELDTYRSILETAAQVCEDIETDSRDHWEEAVRLENGEVIVPPHIASGYERLKSAGLICLTLGQEYGGYALPLLVNSYILEMLARAEPSLMTIVGLQAGVAQDIEKYGSEELKKKYLPRFAAGELQGSMDLTEPQAGSDLGGIVTRATLEADGRWFIDGEKIFITNGGAPVHLVLARDAAMFDQSRGTTNGLSLMLCPRTLDGGKKNGVSVSRVEHKMGIHGSPTCVVEFDHAEAFLLGERGQGFRAMLDLMNNARLGVAAQGIGIAEAAYRQARQYAGDRKQFGAPIIQQPLVKSMLTTMAIHIQAARALLYRTCGLIDRAEAVRARLERGEGDAAERAELERELEQARQVTRFFTPLAKFYATEVSVDVTRKGIQLHGGIGYMAETYAGHFHGDAIITTIYEGTSEIQASFALKEMGKGALFTVLDGIRAELAGARAECKDLVAKLSKGIDEIGEAVPALMSDPQYALLNAKRVCEMVIDVVVSAELLMQAGCSDQKLAGEKLALATTFINRRMPMVELNSERIATGDATRIKRYDKILGL